MGRGGGGLQTLRLRESKENILNGDIYFRLSTLSAAQSPLHANFLSQSSMEVSILSKLSLAKSYISITFGYIFSW